MKLLELFSGCKSEWGEDYVKHKQDELYKIPSDLVYDIFSAI